ncbi:DUF4350 domain-containing protein [Nocardioides piscis]|uniref:DUF4350 domain-containing protein n=1 Tax=Nocardioides piscis TaxID=2714938 RepID=A0A6G7YF25_9ACTN|nr:DUF4350 domain-containing protein [Nocardioides piscis]QIK75370.1 hypothetical protein G7071_07935 [Nocardioides piscis]
MRTWLQRHRALLVVGVGTVLALAVAVLASNGPQTGADLDPDNPGPRGARALARVLAAEGVDVDVVRSAAALIESRPDASTTVVVTSADSLGQSTAEELRSTAARSTIVVAQPGPGTIKALGVDVESTTDRMPEQRAGECTDTGLGDLSPLSIQTDVATSYATSVGCFAEGSGWLVASADEDLVLLGAPGILENDQVLRAENAAVALRLLGQRERLVWYVPSVEDLVAADGVSLRTLLPAWLVPGLWVSGIATLAVVWWRGRRLGPLAVEPLPVSVRSLESTEARGRLYRAASARAHAAKVLRRSTRTALASHLRLPPDDGGALARDVAARVGRPVAEIEDLIGEGAAPPGADDELIRLATKLAELDREVRRT